MPSLSGAVRVAVGTSLVLGSVGLYRRFSRKSQEASSDIKRSITVGRSPAELFDAWFELLPQVMAPFASVSLRAREAVRWTFDGSGRQVYDTDVSAVAGTRLSWRTQPDAKRSFGGSVEFDVAPQARGTQVTLLLHARVPSALAGPAALTALRRFKSLVETGEIASLANNPSARRSAAPNEIGA